MRKYSFSAGLALTLCVGVMPLAAQSAVPVIGANLQATMQSLNGAVTFAYTIAVTDRNSASVSRLRIALDADTCATGDFACLTVETPTGWIGGAKSGIGADWVATPETSVPVGGTRHGFALGGRFVVGIHAYVLEPFLDVETIGIEQPTLEGDFPAYFDKLQHKMRSLSVIGTTIGPAAPPVLFNAIDFIQIVINSKEQAIQLGWVKNQGIGISLDAKLNAALAALLRGDNRGAVNVLNALISEVDAQAGKQLSPEAVALLKFNTQYLIGKLQ